jgi:hypothetical protein
MPTDRRLNWKMVPTRTSTAGNVEFAYRELGIDNPSPPLVFLVHLAAVMDNWGPRFVDGFAARHHVVVFDNRRVGASSGDPATTMEQMATDAICLSSRRRASNRPTCSDFNGRHDRAGNRADGAAPRAQLDPHGNGAGRLRGWLTFQDPTQFLFFTRTPSGLARLQKRTVDRDKPITVFIPGWLRPLCYQPRADWSLRFGE